MVNLYLKAIKDGKMTIDDVPSLWRDRVQAELDKDLQAQGNADITNQ